MSASMPISRRHFLGGAAAVSGAALVGCSTESGPRAGAATTSTSPPSLGGGDDGILVLVNLDGGNDGLNTVCPSEDGRYRSARGALALDPNATHPLSEGFGLHPALSRTKQIWDRGDLAIVHGVGFSGLDRSHFHCRDVWQAANDRPTNGWVGRWLDSTEHDAMAAVAVDRLLPLVLRGDLRSGAVVPPAPFTLPDEAALSSALNRMGKAHRSQTELEAAVAASIGDLMGVGEMVAPVLSHLDGDEQVGTGHSLTAKLETVAALIAADLGTRVFTVQLGGFDTHASQLATHAALLGELDSAIARFLDLIGNRPVTVAVWSEFGRRVAANASEGTDHGKASVMLVAGQVKGGHHGDPSMLNRLDDGDLATTMDFRSVLGGLAEGVLGLDSADVVGKSYKPLSLV